MAVKTEAAKATEVEQDVPPTDDIAVVTPDGRVRIYDAVSGVLLSDLHLSPGVKAVAAGDTNGDGVSELALLTGRNAVVYALSGKKIAVTAVRVFMTSLARLLCRLKCI